MMKIAIVGSGGREHALGKKIKNQNPEVELYFIPGNGGTLSIGTNKNLKTKDEILQFAQSAQIDLTIVGPEAFLVEGIVDDFQQANLPIFGPDKKSAQLEGSKVFAKDFMKKYGISTAQSESFTNIIDAQEYLKQVSYPLVIKASGLAAGKGVVIVQDEIDAKQTLKQMMTEKIFGEAGEHVVIEEFLEGFEVSVLSFFNGKQIYPMLSAKDHKKIGEGDTGLNTGGMGVLVPNSLYTKDFQEDFIENILTPTLEGLQQEELLFSGIIFFGLMVTSTGCKLLEYNVRFGDPETQTLLPLLENNLLETLQNTLAGNTLELQWKNQNSICVVMVSGGYPREYETGFPIHGLEKLQEKDYCVAGAKLIDGELLTLGGRVLNILAQAETVELAHNQVYEKVNKVHFDYNYYRKDIGSN